MELTEPWKAVEEAGGTAELISLEPGHVQAFNHLDKADTFKVDHTAAEADASRYDALVMPGGVANPDFLRVDADAVAFVRAFFDDGKPVAVICHGPWTLIDAGVVTGRTLTSWPSLRTDLRNAGANWVDEEVHVDQGLVIVAQARRPAGVLREARRGVLRGQARGPAPERRRDRVTRPPAAILDVDGTLVDTNYQHALAWFRAFRRLDVTLPLYRIHRHIGMGGDQLVAALAGDDFERAHGDEVRALEGDLYMELIGEVRPLAGARELLVALEAARPRGRARLVGQAARGRPLPRPARRARARRRLDDVRRRRADEAGAGPRARRRWRRRAAGPR